MDNGYPLLRGECGRTSVAGGPAESESRHGCEDAAWPEESSSDLGTATLNGADEPGLCRAWVNGPVEGRQQHQQQQWQQQQLQQQQLQQQRQQQQHQQWQQQQLQQQQQQPQQLQQQRQLQQQKEQQLQLQQQQQQKQRDCRQGGATPNPEGRLLRAAGCNGDNKCRKLILHFDVRNTVLVADSVWSVNVEQALNNYLSGVTWGRETPTGGWQWVSEEPSQKAPAPGLITYYKHLERQTRSTASDRAALRRLTGDFTQEPAGRRFLPHFRRLLNLLEWPHAELSELLTMEGQDGKRYHYLIPAFLYLIRVLVQRNRQFGIVLRTYGRDASQVLQAVQMMARGCHPSFPDPTPVSVHTQPGRVVRHTGGRIQFEQTTRQQPDATPPCPEVVCTESDIYRLLSASEGVVGYVDHFQYWADNDFRHDAAKPFWIDESDNRVQHIFFDDNIRSEDADSIVDVRMFTDASHAKGRSLSMAEWPRYEGACLVQADLLQSIGNRNYFVEQIEQCERRYEALLAEGEK